MGAGDVSAPAGESARIARVTTAMAAIAIATAILLTGGQRPRSVALRLCVSLTAIVIAASVAIALVAQHVHYATDTVAGCCVAVAVVLALALGLDTQGARCGRGARGVGDVAGHR